MIPHLVFYQLGLRAWRMAVLETFRVPALGRHVHHE